MVIGLLFSPTSGRTAGVNERPPLNIGITFGLSRVLSLSLSLTLVCLTAFSHSQCHTASLSLFLSLSLPLSLSSSLSLSLLSSYPSCVLPSFSVSLSFLLQMSLFLFLLLCFSFHVLVFIFLPCKSLYSFDWSYLLCTFCLSFFVLFGRLFILKSRTFIPCTRLIKTFSPPLLLLLLPKSFWLGLFYYERNIRTIVFNTFSASNSIWPNL